MRLIPRAWARIIILFCSLLVLDNQKSEGKNMKYFGQTPETMQLERAIDNDDAKGVAQAISKGADPNTKGLHGVTPIIMAVGKLKKQAAAELLRQGAKPNITDIEGDNAVTLSVRAYKREPQLLEMVMASGGDPNSRFPDGNPVIVYFLNDLNFKGAEYLKDRGADIDAENRARDPLIMSYGIQEDWEVVWFLLDSGVAYDYTHGPYRWQKIFKTPDVTPPDSPLWPFKVKVWKFLKEKRYNVPETIEDLVDEDFWDYLEKNNLPRPKLE